MVVDVPVEVKWCKKHERWEWKDPVNKWGGLSYDLKGLKRVLAKKYKCLMCVAEGNAWPYHVNYVLIDGKLMDFGDFIEVEE